MPVLKESVGLSRSDFFKLSSMRPGMPLDLQVQSPTGTKRLRTEFVGRDGTRALILRFPDESKWGSLRDCIYQDNNLVVRYILEDLSGEIIAFKVKITLIITKPSNLVFTSFPLALQAQSLRAETRAQTSVAAYLFDENEQQLGPIKIVDISYSGCRFSILKSELKQKVATKQAVKLQLNKPSGEAVSIAGVVMNAKAEADNYYFGVKFESSESVIEALLNELLIDVK